MKKASMISHTDLYLATNIKNRRATKKVLKNFHFENLKHFFIILLLKHGRYHASFVVLLMNDACHIDFYLQLIR